eukprot:s429_g1.t1
MPHHTMAAPESVLRKRGQNYPPRRVQNDGDNVQVTVVESFKKYQRLWWQVGLVSCDRCQRLTPRHAGEMQGAPGRSQYAQFEFLCDLRQSIASRKSYAREDEGDLRQSIASRKSYAREDEGPRASRAERRSRLEGAEQRMLSQPPPEDSESDILMQDGFRRKSEVRGPKARQMLTLELDADSPLEMKSIVWKFTERGACVKVLNKHCPEASPEMLRAGDLLTFINDECVLDQPKCAGRDDCVL